jgi:DNA mismatch repair ATPase MutS
MVTNDVDLSATRLLLITGSNMSGKSTLLRAVGVNAVLALAGAPVCARALSLAPLSIGATLRTSDSLQDGVSRFFAEVRRLRAVVALAERSPFTLFLLDEILAGTNSHDRQRGGEAIVKALLDHGAIGLVTTHDLSLAQLADALRPTAANAHFQDRIEGEKLVFDFTLRPGIVSRSNALDLMRLVGLRV